MSLTPSPIEPSAHRPLAVIALGGNALLPQGSALTISVQRERAVATAIVLAELALTHRLIITHGSGPQTGLVADRFATPGGFADSTLDVIDAEIEGMLGYLLVQAFGNAFATEVAAVLTQIVVDPNDPAFKDPTKPIGTSLTASQALQVTMERGWTTIPKGDTFRRVVASPLPLEIVELNAIKTLVANGIVPVCAGGGGIPVVRTDGALSGIEAVIDKDLASSLLARNVGADLLVLLTDVEGLWQNWGASDAQLIRECTPDWARTLDLESGSMQPKVQACADFATLTGNPAYIGSLSKAVDVFAGRSGTRFHSAARPTLFW
jgi:carbamate kinase